MKTILAIDLGKHNSVFCRLHGGSLCASQAGIGTPRSGETRRKRSPIGAGVWDRGVSVSMVRAHVCSSENESVVSGCRLCN
jgi:hypothetical protein